MERYVEPMIEIVRADGPMRAAFDETERVLNRAREVTNEKSSYFPSDNSSNAARASAEYISEGPPPM